MRSTAKPAGTYHHGDLRAALIEAGLALLEERGLADLSLRAIAARVGVSHAAPRRHFASLQALLTAVAAEGFRRHAAALRAGLGQGASRAERLEAATLGYAAFARENPALYALMFSPILVDYGDGELGEAAAASYGVLAEIAQGLDWPAPEEPDRDRRAEAMLWSLVHGHALLAQAGLLGEEGADVRASVADIMPRFGYREG
jgi:AcrR family transcriptional regulator